MKQRDREALNDLIAVIDRALGFPIDDFDAFEQTDLPWRGMAGMRDLLIHAYDRVDLEEVWQAYQQFPAIRKRMLDILNTNNPN